MRFTSIIFLLLLLSTGCPSNRAGAGDDDPPTANSALPADTVDTASANPDGIAKHAVIICSATESDPWTRELLALAGDALGFDPWELPGTSGHLDTYGPYETEWNGNALQVTIALAGLTTVAELLPQQALGAEAREWLAGQEADVLWLDGDPAQLQIGAQLPDGPPILFTGVVNDANLYYATGAQVCGVYQRFSMSGVLGKLWQLDPERFQDQSLPRRYALLTDDSPVSQSRAARFAKLEMALPDDQEWIATPAAHSWDELSSVVVELQAQADALIFCGVGEEGCSSEFLNEPPPADLLEGNELAAVVLGPSRMDQCGAAVLSIRTSATVDEALQRLGKLLAGREAASLGMVVPQDMALYMTESSMPGQQAAADDEALVQP